jgi:hypothetical protein
MEKYIKISNYKSPEQIKNSSDEIYNLVKSRNSKFENGYKK